MAWSDVPAIVALDAWNASEWNAYLVDNFGTIGDAWTSYSPSWTGSSSNPSIGDGTLTGAYRYVGKTVDFRVTLTYGSTTTAGSGTWRFSIPTTATAANMPVGTALIRDSSTGDLRGRVVATDTTSRVLIIGSDGALTTNSAPFTWATGDTITIIGTYEAA